MGAEQVLLTLAGFKEYATGTLLVLELVGTFVFALSGATAGVKPLPWPGGTRLLFSHPVALAP